MYLLMEDTIYCLELLLRKQSQVEANLKPIGFMSWVYRFQNWLLPNILNII